MADIIMLPLKTMTRPMTAEWIERDGKMMLISKTSGQILIEVDKNESYIPNVD